MKSFFSIIYVIFLSILFVYMLDSPGKIVYSKSASEYEIKAAFLIKFTDFIKWPKFAFQHEPDHFVLGILGENVFKHLFDPFINQDIYNKKFHIRYFHGMKELNDISGVHMLFVSPTEKPHFQKIFDTIDTKGMLTISDAPEFIHFGGTIVFVKKGKRIGFEINRVSEKRAGLKISSDLLQLATRVYRK